MDHCGIIQNIEEQCGGIFIADIYMKIFELYETVQDYLVFYCFIFE